MGVRAKHKLCSKILVDYKNYVLWAIKLCSYYFETKLLSTHVHAMKLSFREYIFRNFLQNRNIVAQSKLIFITSFLKYIILPKCFIENKIYA